MVKEFLEGETYRNSKLDKDVLVLGIAKEDASGVKLAILWVDRQSEETTGGDELIIPKSQFDEWELVVL